MTLDDKIGDVWAAYYAFELTHGEDEHQKDVTTRCSGADPKYGELWCSISKDPANRKVAKGELLDRVARALIEKAAEASKVA